MTSTVIEVENLYKEYRLGVISHGTLTHDLQSWWARIRGKEDPNSLISQHHNADAEKDSFLALRAVTFKVKQGDRIGIIGKNGAGKSTLLKIISKITSPTKGQIKIKGRVGSLLEVGTGFHPELTGRENIYLNGAILGMSRSEIDRKLDEIIDFAGVEKHIDTPVKRYSSGMNVRLGFAVAAHLEPEILVVDEVLAVGDAEFQKKAIGKMDYVSRGEGRTILFVSHNMNAIQKLCTRVLLLNEGKIVHQGKTEEIISLYQNLNDNKRNQQFPDRKDSTGSLFVRFTKIEVIDISTGNSSFIESGNDVIFRFCFSKYNSEKIKDDLIFRFTIIDSNYNNLCYISNQITGEKIFMNKEKGIVECTIHKLPLNTGKYSFSVFVGTRKHVYEYYYNAGEFEVASGNFYKSGIYPEIGHSSVLLEYKWKKIY